MRDWKKLGEIFKENSRAGEWLIWRWPSGEVSLFSQKTKRAIMTDDELERLSNREFVDRARGRVLVVGLGLGYVLLPLLEAEGVEEILVVELDPDVIRLVLPTLQARDPLGRLRVVQGDIETWWPADPGEKWDTIYLDIWYNMTAENQRSAERLVQRYSSLLSEGGWCSYWNPIPWHGRSLKSR